MHTDLLFGIDQNENQNLPFFGGILPQKQLIFRWKKNLRFRGIFDRN